jgi:hypothetical protein
MRESVVGRCGRTDVRLTRSRRRGGRQPRLRPRDARFGIRVDREGGQQPVRPFGLDPLHRPDFALYVGAPPNQPQQAQRNAPPPAPSDALNLEPGKSLNVPVAVARNNYDGEIEMSVQGLPEGVTADPVKSKPPAKSAARRSRSKRRQSALR